MKPFSRLAWAAAFALNACASAPGIDRPMPLDPAYAAREAAASKPADRCGPEFISDNLPASVVAFMGPALDGPFRPVCERHDACYELRERSQTWCDTRMRREMLDICAAGRTGGSFGGALCRMRAGIYYGMVDNTFGAYSYHGAPGGRIVRAGPVTAPKGEIEICATAENATQVLQAYAVELRRADGKRIDRAPDVRERKVRAGASEEFCVGTVGSAYWTARRLTGPLELRLLAKDPDSLGLLNERVLIDRLEIALPAPGAD